MHLLVVEDDARVLSFLKDALRTEGYTLVVCETFQEVQDLLEAGVGQFDAVLLDRMLGDHDGAQLIPQIRKSFPQAAILVLSALNTAEERTKVLDLGADDYLGKPFALIELGARIRALSRRYQDNPIRNLAVQDCQVDRLKREVLVKNVKLELTNREYQLLLIFLENVGRVFNRFQLLDKVWNTQFDIESNVVEVTINNLRRKLESSGSSIKILSKRNVGYWVEG